MRRYLALIFTLLLSSAATHSQTPDNSAALLGQGLFPFAMPPFDGAPGPTDVSWLNEKPAGKNGFVRVVGEEFVDGAGKPLRFWGVNLNFNGVFPDKELAPKIAARLAKFGFNSVRIHHFEGNVAPTGLWQPAAIGSFRVKTPRTMDANQLDKMDFFLSELIKQGIYINFNLHVAQKVTEAEGFVNAASLPEKDKGIAVFYDPLTKHQKSFWGQLLRHVNPYRGLAYKDDPGVCAVEVANENSLLQLWLEGSLGKIPDPYQSLLWNKWNAWLRQEYTHDSNLRLAWTEWTQALGTEELLAAPASSLLVRRNSTQVVRRANGANGAPGLLLAPRNPGGPPDGIVILPAPEVNPEVLAGADGTLVVPMVPPEPLPMEPFIPMVNEDAVRLLGSISLAVSSGAVGNVTIDEVGGPAVDGIVQPSLQTTLRVPGTVAWSFQLVRGGLSIQEGQGYTLSFWARADDKRRISANFWQDATPSKFLGFTAFADLTEEWQPYSYSFRAGSLDGNKARLTINLGNKAGQVQFGAFSLRSGGTVAAPDNWTLRGGVPLVDGRTTPILQTRKDFARFLGSLEAAHVAEMRAFLLTEVGVKVPLWHTQAQFGGWGGVQRELASDVIDNHAYWKHPDFAGGGWNASTWRVENQSMVAAQASDPLTGYALSRVRGKPFVVSEWNSGQPNDFGAESLLMAAAYGAWQNWAAIWVFDYHSSGSYDRDRFEGFFSIDSVPTKMVTAPLAALVFRRPAPGKDGGLPRLGDLEGATSRATLTLSADRAWEETASTFGPPTAAPFAKTWTGAGAGRNLPVGSNAGVNFAESLFPVPNVASLENETRWAAGDSRWHWDGKRGMWSARAPLATLFAGNLGAGIQNLGNLRIQSNSRWGAGGLVSMDGKTIPASKKLLLVLAGKSENVGMRWNADRTSVGNEWGRGPVHAEGISGAVRLTTDAPAARVWVLDAAGQRRDMVPSEIRNGQLRFYISPYYRSLWYEIEAD